MKIVEQTPTLLKLQKSKNSLIRDYANVFGPIMLLNVFILAGLFMFYIGSSKSIKCNRIEPTQVDCKFTSHTFLGDKTTSVRKVKNAESQIDEDGQIIVLLTQEGEIFITDFNILDNRVLQEINKINNFIRNPQQKSLIVKQIHNWPLYIFGAIFIIFPGLLIIALLREKVTTIIILDKDSSSMYLRRRGFLGTENINCKLDEINRARVEEVSSEENCWYYAELVLVSGRKIRLNLASTSLYSSRKLTTSINQFLHRIKS